jgi:hypothetical protein
MSGLTVVEARELLSKPRIRPPSRAFVEDRSRRRASGRKVASLDPLELWAEFLPLAGGASSFNVVLDTTAPGGPALALNGGATATTSVDITAALTTTDNPVTGYQIAIWGSVDTAFNASIQTNAPGGAAPASSWITPTWSGTGPFTANQAVRVTAGDGTKTINARIRDDVWNETATLTQTISLDTVAPTVNWTTGPDTTKVSTVTGKRTVNATFTVGSEAITAWEVAVVANSGSARGTGTVIGTANGSTGVSGGAKAAAATQAVVLDARDIQAASAGDGTKVIKVFVSDAAGNWSS